MTIVDLIFGFWVACVASSAAFCGWTAGRLYEEKIWQSRLNIMRPILKSRRARAPTEVEELREYLPIVRAEELKDA